MSVNEEKGYVRLAGDAGKLEARRTGFVPVQVGRAGECVFRI